ncbi:IS4 family transposase [Fimbriiglobus ruber]|uniref:IS4 family transposase n=1 Tax=Fimbriiglobus ruber TaxID=1908690 RepID=UPI00137AD2F9|nr:IS4 family transposase [Fimbriiglobus ruber]
MSHPTTPQVGWHRHQLTTGPDLPFENLLTPDQIDQAVRADGVRFRARMSTPAVTLWAFLWQVVDPNGSCHDAVLRVIGWCVRIGRRPPSTDTGAYGKARGRLPFGVIRQLAREVADRTADHTRAKERWRGHRVRVVDGTTVSMPDTPANQAAFPQPRTQARGIGFPIARLVAVFGLGCGSALGWAVGRYQGKGQGETSLALGLLDEFAAGDVMLADRYYSGYGIVARAAARGVHYVGRAHAARRVDFRRGRRLGAGDHVVTWVKPTARPAGWTATEWDALPPTLDVREIRVIVRRPGFRTRRHVVVTTLRDPVGYPPTALADLYRRRWTAELDLRALKVTLGMDVLRCQSPDLVRKEIGMHVLVYNLIRGVMAAAARAGRHAPRTISFAGAWSAIRGLADIVCAAPATGWAILLRVVRATRVGHRPDRVEPRVKKRRPKPHRLMKHPRDVLRQRLQRHKT